MKQHEDENATLKKLSAEAMLDACRLASNISDTEATRPAASRGRFRG